jgi:hypothetical protein
LWEQLEKDTKMNEVKVVYGASVMLSLHYFYIMAQSLILDIGILLVSLNFAFYTYSKSSSIYASLWWRVGSNPRLILSPVRLCTNTLNIIFKISENRKSKWRYYLSSVTVISTLM